MVDPRGFLTWAREEAAKRSVAQRVRDWREFYLPRTAAQRREQASRCMGCGVPFCQQGCPLGNAVPDFQNAVGEGRWRDAWLELSATNNFPEFTGRVCPAPCEAACVLNLDGAPVTIEQIEREIAERAWAEGWVRPQPPSQRTGKTVAIVGSGPAGLAAAQQLARAGHDVTVFERDERPGGLLRFGIPDFKLDKWVVDRRLGQLRAEGVRFQCGVEVGVEPTWDALHAQFDALLIAIGAQQPHVLKLPGIDADGVHLAMDYLAAQNRAGAEGRSSLLATGRHVLVLGGGDTGSDCVGTAVRQGAASVRQVELMPAPPTRTDAWPRWPVILRSSSSHEEGCSRHWGLRTTHLEVDGDGRVSALVAEPVQQVDGVLRPALQPPVRVETDLILLAIGFRGPKSASVHEQLGIAVDGAGRVQAVGTRTNQPGIYVAGDAGRGASLVVWAIHEGRHAARAIDADLMGRARLPDRGQHCSFEMNAR